MRIVMTYLLTSLISRLANDELSNTLLYMTITSGGSREHSAHSHRTLHDSGIAQRSRIQRALIEALAR